MNYEENRLRTFKNWPSNASVDPRKIAKAGFYYMGQGAEVQCFSCGGRISDWNYGDRVIAVITRHKMLDSGCPFIRDPQAAGNVPISANSRRVSESSQSSRMSESDSSRVGESSPESTQAGEALPDSSNRAVNSRSLTLQQGCSRSNRCSQRPCSQREIYESESARLDSFARWPLSYISPQQLAKAGFFYTGYADKVECFYCEGTLDSWEEGDSPVEEHRHQYPTCPFLLSMNHGIHLRTNDSSTFNGDYEGLKDLGVHKHRIPRSPKYSTFESRLRSYKNWPPSIPQTPQQLSDAGFYFTGRGDQVRCFHCDGGLRLWESGDEPWIEHARWFSDCGFLFLVRGQQFIDQALDSLRTQQPSSMKAESRGVKRKQQPLRLKSVTEEQLQAAMSSQQAFAALQIGLNESRVKMALKQRLESSGEMFSTAEELIGAAFSIQVMEEESDTEDVWGTPPNSPAVLNSKSRVSPRREILSRPGSTCTTSPRPSPVRELTVQSSSSDSSRLSQPDTTSLSLSDKGVKKIDAVSRVNDSGSTSEPKTNSVKVTGDVEEELRRLREWRQCKVCMDSEVGVVLLPCGHLVTCVQCTHSLADCPLCRTPIQAIVRTFLS